MKVLFQLSPKRQSVFLSFKDVFEVTEVNGGRPWSKTGTEAITWFLLLETLFTCQVTKPVRNRTKKLAEPFGL